CQVCLPTADVGPLHCLLSFEAGAATVTRWAKGALLNGREFSKSPLENGHKISIGRWELEFGGWQGQVVAAQAGAERSQPREPKAEAQIQAEVAPLVASTSQAFEDRLVLDLWTKTFQA